MKQLAFFLFAGLTLFAASFSAGRTYQTKKNSSLLEHTFSPAPYPIKNRSFAVVIIGFNNGATVEKTLASLFSQNYENYRLIYIDDASDNGSFDLAKEWIYQSDRLDKTTLVHNEERLGILTNIVRAVQVCADEEIVVVVSGEDWLAHEWVLQRLNAYYADPNLWMSFAQSIDFPSYQLSPYQSLEKFRLHSTSTPHLKSFYAALFKKIKEKDLIEPAAFLSAAPELAYIAPMIEMGQDHFSFIDEVLVVHNQNTTYREDRKIEVRCDQLVRSLEPYAPLKILKEYACPD